jgi:hypothetical protein
MRRLIAVAVVIAGAALPMCAQRGGGARGGSMGHGGGFSGGFASRGGPSFSGGFASRGSSFASRSVPVFRGSPTAMGRPNLSATSPVGLGRYAGFAPRPNETGTGARTVYSNGRPVYPVRDRYGRPWIPVYGLGVPYGGIGFYGANCGWYWDCGYGYDGYPDQGYGSGYASPGAAPTADYSPDYSAQQNAQPAEQAEATPADTFRPAYERPQPEPQPEEDAVTLVFKDGRPNLQIHNYMLTRTTLYVQDARHREIPVDELDLAATEKVNKDAGVAFQLPGASR